MYQGRNRLNPGMLAAVLLSAFPMQSSAAPAGFEQAKQDFVAQMVAKHGFSRPPLEKLFAGARYRQKIIDAITRPAEAKPWYKYRPIFVTDKRAREGVAFWRDNAALLDRAEREYGVPASMIVAIIGIETRYGRHTGGYPVVDALTTLGFAYPKRGQFFQRELEEFLLLSREEQVDAASAEGSYAGALGKPQFIPSSYRAYAVDFDGDKRRDLWNSNADVIGSVAAYFKRHGWVAGEPIATLARGANDTLQALLKPGSKPSLTVDQLTAAGVRADSPLPQADKLSLFALDSSENEREYWIGFNNFYVITRYNHSDLYAMSALQLSHRIEQLYREDPDLASQ